jgi:hypothetical protein
MLRDLLAGRLGVDATAQVSMSATSALRQALSGAVVALMYSGDNVLEDIDPPLRARISRSHAPNMIAAGGLCAAAGASKDRRPYRGRANRRRRRWR